MTRDELKVGQILHDEKENSYLVYRINDKKNSAYCLDGSFTNTIIGLDWLKYFHVDDEINIDLLISQLSESYDFNVKEYVKGWNDGRNCAFDIILNLLERIDDKNGCCQNDKIKLVIDGFRMIEKGEQDDSGEGY